MVEELVKTISFRKKMYSYLNVKENGDLNKIFDTMYWNNGIIAYNCDKEELIKPNKKVALLINPNNEPKTYELDEYYSVFISSDKKTQKVFTKNGMISPLSIQILYKK